MDGTYAPASAGGGITGGRLCAPAGWAAVSTDKIQGPAGQKTYFHTLCRRHSRRGPLTRARLSTPVVLETEVRRWEFVIFRRAAFLRGLRSAAGLEITRF